MLSRGRDERPTTAATINQNNTARFEDWSDDSKQAATRNPT